MKIVLQIKNHKSSNKPILFIKVDQFLEKLVSVFEERDLLQTVNLVVTGVHGYTEVTTEGVVDISNYISDKVMGLDS
jgi:hypothetical protein